MANHPFYRSSDKGLAFAPVATALPAGLRSLISDLHGHVPPRLGRWAIPVRLAVAGACFAGGFPCARLFVECLFAGPAACPCVVPQLPSLVTLAITLLPLCAAALLTPAKTASRRHRTGAARAFRGLRHPLRAYTTGTSHG